MADQVVFSTWEGCWALLVLPVPAGSQMAIWPAHGLWILVATGGSAFGAAGAGSISGWWLVHGHSIPKAQLLAVGFDWLSTGPQSVSAAGQGLLGVEWGEQSSSLLGNLGSLLSSRGRGVKAAGWAEASLAL